MRFSDSFTHPPRTHSPLAFWFWNGELEPDRLRRQIDEMVDKGVYGGFMHSRGYLKTPYLEQPWWDAVDACVDQARRKGFFPWLYDEYAWPSGTAGSTFDYGFQKPSRVLALGEANMAKSLAVREARPGEEPRGPVVGRYAVSGEGESLSFRPLAEGEAFPGGARVLEFTLLVHPAAVDYLNPDTIRTFLNFTHEEYKKRYGADFGSLIPGIFFDEIFMTGSLPWTDRLPQEFRRRTGRDLLALLPLLAEEGGTRGREARMAYYSVVAQLYEEAFFKQIGDWCGENGLDLTGHTEEHLGGHPRRQGNYFDTTRHLQIPGADCHDYRYRFPRKITYVEPKYSVSVARAYGRERAMSEAMGGAGWGCSLQQFKRGVNTMGAMGISMFVLHGFYYECEHQGSQADWPTSFFYQNPYWKYFKAFADYMNRICLVNASGRAVVETGLLYPIEEMQAETLAGGPTRAGRALDRAYHRALSALLERQIDTDLVDSRSLLAGELRDGALRVGDQAFRVLLLPDPMELPAELAEKLERFTAQGGHVIRYRCDGSPAGAVEPEDLPKAVNRVLPPDIEVLAGSRFDLYACHRVIEGRDWYFVTNSSPRPRSLTLRLRVPCAGALEKYSPETGGSVLIPASPDGSRTRVCLELGPDEACYLAPAQAADIPAPFADAEELAVAGRWSFLPLDDSFDGKLSIDATQTELELPLATFTSELHADPAEIRVMNTSWEEGRAGRHLSLWDGRWIGRRPSWHCAPQETDLYFRGAFRLDTAPSAARLSMAAVNSFALWVNGEKVLEAESRATPVEADVAKFLRQGENLIAVHVHNDRPLPHADLNSVEELPKDRLITLLLQGDFPLADGRPLQTGDHWIVSNRPEEGWNLPGGGFEAKAVRLDPSGHNSIGGGAPDGAWLYAWERGAPPLLPWGDLPLFGQRTAYPVRVHYGITLPAGTAAIALPKVQGAREILLDGQPVTWQGEFLPTKPQPFPRRLDISVTAAGPEDGLKRPVRVTVEPFATALGDWRLHGLDWFSGRCLYRNTLRLHRQEGRYVLDLGQVCFAGEVWVNGRLVDVKVWEPYRADITDYLVDGANEIAVVAANSAAVERRRMLVDEGQALGWARYWNRDNMDREGENLVSGLLGPVRVFRQAQEETP